MNIDCSGKTNPVASEKQDWKMGLSEEYWTGLLTSIHSKKCIAFIGPSVYTVLGDDGRDSFC